jgi:RND family efflux transporter MFP subunit
LADAFIFQWVQNQIKSIMRFKMNNNTHHQLNKITPGSLPGLSSARNFTTSIADHPPQRSGELFAQPATFKYFPNLKYKQRRLILAATLICCSLLILGGCLAWWLSASTLPAVTLYRVGNPQTVNIAIGGGGIIFPQQQFDLAYPATENIVSVPVKPGDYVKTNQVLIGLDPTQINVSLQQASADVQAAQNYLSSVEASGNAVTIAQAEQSYQLAKNRYDALNNQVSSGQLRNGNLTSPLNGIVTAVNVTAGEVVPANTTLITVMNIQTVLVHVNIPLTYLGQIQIGQPAQVTPSSLSTLTVTGTVSSIIPQVDTATDTFEVWISIPNPNMKLLPGMSAFAHIQSSLKAFALPSKAVTSSEDASTVFIVRNQVAHLLQVQIVAQTVDTTYVDNALMPGNLVVLGTQRPVHDGQHVRVTSIQS